MTISNICIGSLALIVVFGYVAYSRLLGRNASLESDLKDMMDYRLDIERVTAREAFVEERKGIGFGYFAVYRPGVFGKIDITRLFFDPDNADDREYKKLLAEETADKLNEGLEI